MADKINWQVLYVDDDEENLVQIKEFLDGYEVADGDLTITTLNNFDKALDYLATYRYDVIILDLRLGPIEYTNTGNAEGEAGEKTLKLIQARQFVPIIFYTALPGLVNRLKSPLIRVVEKTNVGELPNTINSIFNTLLPKINRALLNHVETVQRDYMWNFVATHWDQISKSPDHSSLAYLLARRLARSLSEKGIGKIISSIGGQDITPQKGVHPMQYYVMPAVDADFLAGDIFKGVVGDKNSYWVLLTPSCDLVAGRDNADFVLFAQCDSLFEHEEYKKWKEKPEKHKEGFERFIGNRRKDRFYYLPSVLNMPDLVVDLQALATLPYAELAKLERIASLDSPYAEAILTRFSRYFSRIGVPDLDMDIAMSRLSK